MRQAFRLFFTTETLGGLALIAATAAALAAANGPLHGGYIQLQNLPMLGKTLTYWVNDALMALFFLLVGLEVKRELLVGQLATWHQRILPGLTAVGGMLVPAVIYLARSAADPHLAAGWAIPAATDIAFALGILALFGSRVPVSLKIFLTAVAILDDIGAILIIALFYTAQLNLLALVGAAALTGILVAFNRFNIHKFWPYLLVGAGLWWCVYMSGLHATLAGVVVALTIPMQTRAGHSPLLVLEHAIQPYIAFAVLPVFAFLNAGVSLAGFGLASLSHPLTAAIFWGLFAGKQLGIGGAYYLATRYLGAPRLAGASGWHVYAVAVLCGVGFTMSLFIGNLAFSTPVLEHETRLGILLGSFASALLASTILLFAPRPKAR